MAKNYCELEGNLTKDLELKTTQNGTAYTFFSVAVARDSGSGTDFVPIKAFGELAVSAEKALKKGDPIRVVGNVTTSSYEDKNQKMHYSTEVLAREIVKMQRKVAAKVKVEG